MVMLPGGGVCYRGAIPIAEEMAKVYHVVLVAYDGFNPDEPGTEYKSTQDEAKRLGDYVVEHYGGRIDILYGVSYGTFVLIEDHFKYRQAVMEAYPCGHYPVFEGYNHMQYQIRDPRGFAEMLTSIAEHDGMPKLPFIRKCEDPI